MSETTGEGIDHYRPERLTAGQHLLEALRGLGVIAGLAFLWVLEVVRDRWFDLLDRLNFRPRRRTRASAFPPGRPRRKKTP